MQNAASDATAARPAGTGTPSAVQPLDLLDAGLRARGGELARRFRAAQPFPHLVLEPFFAPGFCERLIAEFPAFERGNTIAESGQQGRKSAVPDVRSLGPTYRCADDVFRSPAFAAFMSELTGIPDLLYDPDYVGGGTHENLAGQELDPHVDFNFHPRTGWHRRLNLILYLNPVWEETWGGALELHTDPHLPPEQDATQCVLPLANRAVVFETSERSWHGFAPIRPPDAHPGLSRRSLAIYLYTADRPAAETAPRHATVYVERPLPFPLRAGAGLSDEASSQVQRMLKRRSQHIELLARRDLALVDEAVAVLRRVLGGGLPLDPDTVAVVERLFARHDALLRLLYEREKDVQRDLATLRRILTDATPREHGLVARGRVAGDLIGYHDDHWCDATLVLELVAAARSDALVFRGFVPPLLAAGQPLECRIGGERWRQRFAPGAFEWTVPLRFDAGERARVEIRAGCSLVPRRDVPGSRDERQLAYQLHAVELRAPRA